MHYKEDSSGLSLLNYAPCIPSLIFNYPAIVASLFPCLFSGITARRGGKDLDKQTGNSKKVSHCNTLNKRCNCLKFQIDYRLHKRSSSNHLIRLTVSNPSCTVGHFYLHICINRQSGDNEINNNQQNNGLAVQCA